MKEDIEKEIYLLTWVLKARDELLEFYENNKDVALRKVILLVDFVLKENNYFNFHKIIINEHQLKKLDFYLEEITKNFKPIEYILGSYYFLKNHINIIPPVLIPRIETEYWCEIIIEKLKKNKIEKFYFLDIGCGSGCISIAFLNEFKLCNGIALDISEKAIELTKRNVIENSFDNRLKIIYSDLFENLKEENKFDIIFSNPPYIAENQKLDNSVFFWEDKNALFAPDDGLFFIKKILENSLNFLKSNGLLIIECDSLNVYEAFDFAYKLNKYQMIKLLYDQHNQARVIILSLDKKSFLNIEEEYL